MPLSPDERDAALAAQILNQEVIMAALATLRADLTDLKAQLEHGVQLVLFGVPVGTLKP